MVMIGFFLPLGGFLRLHTKLDAFLKGVDAQQCLQGQPPVGLVTSGCGFDPTLKIGEQLNDSLSLVALAWAIGMYLRKKNKKERD